MVHTYLTNESRLTLSMAYMRPLFDEPTALAPAKCYTSYPFKQGLLPKLSKDARSSCMPYHFNNLRPKPPPHHEGRAYGCLNISAPPLMRAKSSRRPASFYSSPSNYFPYSSSAFLSSSDLVAIAGNSSSAQSHFPNDSSSR